MAHRSWKHFCKVENKERFYYEEICPDCNERGEYDGWHLSVVEHMCSYANRTKLAPYGPHRNFADTLLTPRFKKCPNCNGDGVIERAEINKWGHDHDICPVCNFGRYIFDGAPEEFNAIRKQVLTAYPGNASPRDDNLVPATTEPAPTPPPPADEPEPGEPTSPEVSPSAFFARPRTDAKEEKEIFAKRILNAIEKAYESEHNFQITDHRSKYTYLLKWWGKRGGTFHARMDGIELRSISRPDVALAVLFIESPFVASVIVDWELEHFHVAPKDLARYRKSIPRPDRFQVVGGAAYLPIDTSFTQAKFNRLLDALQASPV